LAENPQEDGFEHSYRCVSQVQIATLGAFRNELGRAAAKAAWKTIEVTSNSG
jgi:hypothetical protein